MGQGRMLRGEHGAFHLLSKFDSRDNLHLARFRR